VILEFLITTIVGIVWAVLDILPEYTFLPEAARNAFDQLVPYFGIANKIFPVDTLFAVAVFVFYVEGAFFLFKMFNWLFDKVRGAG